MSFIRTIEKISYLDYLIRGRETGCARELADRIGVSVRTVHTYLGDLRSLGAPISWSYIEQSYIYRDPGKIKVYFDSDYPPEIAEIIPRQLVTARNHPGRQEVFINL